MKVFLKELSDEISVPINGNNIQLLGNIYPIYVNKLPDNNTKLTNCVKYYAPKLIDRLIHYLTIDLKYKYGVSSTFLITSVLIRNVQFFNTTIKVNNTIRSKLKLTINTNIFNNSKDKCYGYYYSFDEVNLKENKFNLQYSNCLIKPVFDLLSKRMYLPPNIYKYTNNTIEFSIKKKYIVHLDELHTKEYLEIV